MQTRKLRTKKPINYYEPEEPSHDAYEFCEQCNDFIHEFCTLHGGLLVIPDDRRHPQVPPRQARPEVPRAMLTVPAAFLYIDTSSIPGAGLGVFAKTTLPRGARFGPYRGRRLPAPASDYGWQVSGRRAQAHVVDAGDATRSNWMRYVNCARRRAEQNLLAYQYYGDIYYRTSQIISAGRELLVYYGSEFASKLNIDIQMYNKSPVLHKRVKDNIRVTTKNHGSEIQEVCVASTDNFADSLISTSSELRRVNACAMGTINLNKYFNKPREWKEMEFLSILKNIGKLERANIKQISTDVNTVHDEPKVSSTSANDESIILDINDSEEFNFKTDDNRKEKEKLEFSEDGKKINHNIAKGNWKCTECNKLLPSREQLRTHIRIHRGAQKFQCEICGYKTDVQHYYRRHELVHNKEARGEKPKKKVADRKGTQGNTWQCDECQQQFETRNKLRHHRRIHGGARKFNCEVCDYGTDELCYFARHKRSKHRVRAEMLKCGRCNFTCRNAKAFAVHCALHDNAAARRCELCPYLGARRQDVRAHAQWMHHATPIHLHTNI